FNKTLRGIMLSVREAQKIVLHSEFPVRKIRLPVIDSPGMVIARDIISRDNIPAYDSSSVNGYAIRSIDVKGADKSYPVKLLLRDEDIPAGKVPVSVINPGFCVSIMTGAPVPCGADAVVMKEDTQRDESHVLIFREVREGENIRRSGEDIGKGNIVLSAGTRIYPAETGVLASIGISEVEVQRPPAAGIISVGNELVAVDGKLERGKVRDSNSFSISSQLKETGIDPLRYGIVEDHEKPLKDIIEKAILRCDILVLSGGISNGENDIVKDVLQDMGASVLFWRVRQMPGGSMAFFKLRGKLIFGLPGDPVSAMICFEMYVRPLIRKVIGYIELFRPSVRVRASHNFELKKGSTSFLRVFVLRREDGLWFQSAGKPGSVSLSSMLCANGIAEFPEDMAGVGKGTYVKVHLLKDLV
ncbi:MAG: molybdopterin molybdotransferase MoeA, partial [Actinobacteria bacterium]|nr:molybdopterin molybdotransferase MoeA [Actinomycetota bacterium]